MTRHGPGSPGGSFKSPPIRIYRALPPLRSPSPRVAGLWWTSLLAVAILVLAALPLGGAEVVVTDEAQSHVAGHAPVAPLSPRAQTIRTRGCVVTGAGSVPFGPGSARGSALVQEAGGCRSGSTFRFLPLLTFPDALASPGTVTLDAQMVLLGVSGDTGMLAHVQLYLQKLGGRNPIVTGTHIRIRNGVVVSSSTSVARLFARPIYGPGIALTLNHPAQISSTVLTLLVEFQVLQGGKAVLLTEEYLTFTLTY
jgi:hypothetical protein